MIEKLLAKIKTLLQLLKKEITNPKTLLLFIIVVLIVSSEVWVFYILYWITGNGWFLGIATSCWAFWLLPFPAPPFIPICLGITVGIKALRRK